jgi:hypothetical protein
VDGLVGAPTTCLCFLGMVTADRLKDDEEYEDVRALSCTLALSADAVCAPV